MNKVHNMYIYSKGKISVHDDYPCHNNKSCFDYREPGSLLYLTIAKEYRVADRSNVFTYLSIAGYKEEDLAAFKTQLLLLGIL